MRLITAIITLTYGLSHGPAQQHDWSLVATASSPPAQSGHAMAYDSSRGIVVLYGGGQTWEFDGFNWTQAAPLTSPTLTSWCPSLGGRRNAAMAYDAGRGRVVLFGGEVDGLCGGWQAIYWGDTWEYDGVTWTLVATASSPSAQSGHAMAYDSSRGRVVLYGGGQTWEFDGFNWTHASNASSPSISTPCGVSGRIEHAMAFLDNRGSMILFGGRVPALCGGWQALSWGDTWRYDNIPSIQGGRTLRLVGSVAVGQMAAIVMEHPQWIAGNYYGFAMCSPTYPGAISVSVPGVSEGLLRLNPLAYGILVTGVLDASGQSPAFVFQVPNNSLLVGATFDVQGADEGWGGLLTLTDNDLELVIAP